MDNDIQRVDAVNLAQFSRNVLIASGCDPDEAQVVADILVWCDTIGRPNQGVWRLPILCERLKKGLYASPCGLKVEMTAPSIGVADGNAGLGHYVAFKVMQKTIAVAKDQGIGAISVKNSNYFGAGGYYAAMAANEDLIGIALSNSFPKVRAYKGSQAVLGTNPLSFSCPALDNEPLILDMATSEVAGSTVRKQNETAENRNSLNIETNSPQLPKSLILEPLGGPKGYGLALMVEILSGVLSGSGFSHQVKSMYENFEESGNNGHFFIAIDIEKFLPLVSFRERMTTLVNWLLSSGETNVKVQYPGENRWSAYRSATTNGIDIDSRTKIALKKLAQNLQVQSM